MSKKSSKKRGGKGKKEKAPEPVIGSESDAPVLEESSAAEVEETSQESAPVVTEVPGDESAGSEEAPAEAEGAPAEDGEIPPETPEEPAAETAENTEAEGENEGEAAEGETESDDPAENDEDGPLPEASPEFPLKRVIEAILFASQKPVSVKELRSVLKGSYEADKENRQTAAFGKIKEPAIREAVAELVADYEATGRSFDVRESAAGWQLVTRPEFYPWLRQLYPENRSARLSAPAMETLAIIAYRQPITRADIEAIRGVAVDGVMQTLLDRGLVKIGGRAEIPGRPLLYETTQFFMEHFGLTNLGDLPNAQELRKVPLPTATPAEEKPADGKSADKSGGEAGSQEATPAGDTAESAEAPPAPEPAAAETVDEAPVSEEVSAPANDEPAAFSEEPAARETSPPDEEVPVGDEPAGEPAAAEEREDGHE